MTGLELLMGAAAECFLGLSVKGLWKEWNRLNKKEDEELRKQRIKALKKGEEQIIRERLASRLLNLYYPSSELEAQGLFRYKFGVSGTPIGADIVTKKDWLNLKLPIDGKHDSYKLVGSQLPKPHASEEEVAKLLFDLHARGLRVEDNPIYQLVEFDSKGKSLRASFALDTYVRHRLTLGSLEDEMNQALINADFEVEKAFQRKGDWLGRRAKLLPDARAVADFGTRTNAGGVAVLFAIQRPRPDDDFVFAAKRRSQEVAGQRGMINLIPNGYHQPISNDLVAEAALYRTVYREAYEELFGGQEVAKPKGREQADWYFQECEALRWLRERPEDFVLEVVSLGLSLVDGNYNLGVLLAVNNLEFWRRYGHAIETNWEVEKWGPTTKGALFSTKDSANLTELLKDPSWAEDSLFGLVEGLKRLKQLEQGRVKPPKLEQVSN